VSAGCERLERAVAELAQAHGLDDLEPVAGSYFHGEAVAFAPPSENLAPFAFDVLENVEGNLVEFRLLEQQGELFFALVPMTEEAASALADALFRCARWRARR
jgi:hypothetical protein